MAACPFCLEKLDAREMLQGRLMECPRCGKSLGGSRAASSRKSVAARTPPARENPRPRLERIEEDEPPPPVPERKRPAAPPSRSFEPEEDESAEAPLPPPKVVPAFAARRPAKDEEHEEEDEDDDLSVIARLARFDTPTLAAFFLGSVAFSLASIPPLSSVSKLVAGIGALLGLVGLIAALRRATRPVFPLFVVALCAFDLAVMGTWPRRVEPPLTGATSIPLAAHAKEGPRPVKEDEWIDADAFALRQHGAQVQLAGVRLLPAEALGKARPPRLKGKVLLLQLRINKDGKPLSADTFQSWSDTPAGPSKNPPLLTDSASRGGQPAPYMQVALDAGKLGEVLKRATPKAPPPASDESKEGDKSKGFAITIRSPAAAASAPERSPAIVQEVLVFTPPPPPEVDELRLELPAAAFGLEGRFRFKIPRAMIREE